MHLLALDAMPVQMLMRLISSVSLSLVRTRARVLRFLMLFMDHVLPRVSSSITYAGHEILQWNDDWDPDFPPHTPSDVKMMAKYKGYLADFDSGTTCMLLPNSTNDGQVRGD